MGTLLDKYSFVGTLLKAYLETLHPCCPHHQLCLSYSPEILGGGGARLSRYEAVLAVFQ
jgi:hypothetical protein